MYDIVHRRYAAAFHLLDMDYRKIKDSFCSAVFPFRQHFMEKAVDFSRIRTRILKYRRRAHGPQHRHLSLPIAAPRVKNKYLKTNDHD